MAITGSDLISAIIDMADPIPRKPWYYARRHYECLSCKEGFTNEDAKRIREPHGEWMLYCPHCGSGEVADAEEQLIREQWAAVAAEEDRRQSREME